jgi:hypothetical protein
MVIGRDWNNGWTALLSLLKGGQTDFARQGVVRV